MQGKFRAVSRLIRLVQPELAVPFAGPMCFLDPEIQQHNRWLKAPGLFPDQKQAAEVLSARLPGQKVGLWLPGDEYEPLPGVRSPTRTGMTSTSMTPMSTWTPTPAARRGDIEAVRAAFPEPGADLRDAFVEHFRRLGEMSPYFLDRIDMTVRFELTGEVEGRWDVDLRPDGVRVDLGGGPGSLTYGFRMDSRWLAPVIFGQIGWEDLFLSLRFSAWRDPDIYNDYLIGFLKHAEPQACRP